MKENGFFERMSREAIEELASGEVGWRDMPTNVLLMACFGMLYNHLAHKLTRPLWLASGAVATGVTGYLVHLVFG